MGLPQVPPRIAVKRRAMRAAARGRGRAAGGTDSIGSVEGAVASDRDRPAESGKMKVPVRKPATSRIA